MSFLFQLVLACERPFEKIEESGEFWNNFFGGYCWKKEEKEGYYFCFKKAF